MDTLNSMRVFVRVIETGSFTAAAQALDLSTAQVSRLVSELEQQLQARLLHRTTRRLGLTEVGERYLQRCRSILDEVDQAAAEARGAHLKPDPIEDGQDVVLTFARELPDSQRIAQSLGQMYSVLCASPDYLARHGVPSGPADLRRHRYLRLLDPLYQDNWTLSDEHGEYDVLPAEAFQVNVAESLARAAQAGMGFCLLPSFVACQPLREGSLLRLLPEHRLRERNIYAIYPSRHFIDAKIRTWVDFLKAELPPLFAQDDAVLDDPRHWARPTSLLR